jgi:hypothetical protein
MNELQVVMTVVAVNACVLGIALLVLYRVNKDVSRSGR